MSELLSTDGSTPNASVVNSTTPTTAVNAAQTETHSAVTTSPAFSVSDAQIADLNKRINNLMSLKDKEANEKQQVLDKLNKLSADYLALQQKYSADLEGALKTATDLAAQKKSLEVERDTFAARTTKLNALANKPELLPYANLIPDSTDQARIDTLIAELEQIRQAELAKYTSGIQSQTAPATQTVGQQVQQQAATPGQTETVQQIMQRLYGNRASINPAYIQPPAQTGQPPVLPATQTSTPGSTPAQMNPSAPAGMDVSSQITQLLNAAAGKGEDAYNQAVAQAALLANAAVAGR